MENLMFPTMRQSGIEKRKLSVLNQCFPLPAAEGNPLALSLHSSPFTLPKANPSLFTLPKANPSPFNFTKH
jgi:hypothetical protein